MLVPPSSFPYTSGLWLNHHAELPPSLQHSLDSAVVVTNSIGRAITLGNAIQMEARFAARGTTQASSAPDHAPAPSFQAPFQAPTPTPTPPQPAIPKPCASASYRSI